MSIIRTDKTEIEAQLAVSISKEDYEPKLKSELQKYRQKAQMRGFRKGKVPMSVIKKMYGKAMLADVVNELVQKELGNYLEEEKLNLLGQPLPAEDQETYDFDLTTLKDFDFKFDVGLAPEFELKGLSEATEFDQLVVVVTDDMIEQDLMAARKRAGKEVHPEGDYVETDSITFDAKELEGDDLKKKGLETSFKVLISSIDDEALKDQILKSKKGEVVRFNIFELEKDKDEQYVRKYLLNLESEEIDREVGQHFEATIVDSLRIDPADLDEEFFIKAFGEDVKSEDEARAKIKEHIQAFYNRQVEALSFRDFQEKLMELNTIDLPDDFLQRWLLASNEKLEADQLEQEYPDFARNLAWSLVERNVIKQYELKVEVEEVRQSMRNQIMQYMNSFPLPPETLDKYVDEMMQNREQVNKAYEEKMSDKVFEKIRDIVTLNPKPIALEDFEKVIQEAKAAQQGHSHPHTEEE